MCECGQTCPAPDDNSSSKADTSPSLADMDVTNTIIFSNQSDDTETNFTVTTESNLKVLNVSHKTVNISANFVAGMMELFPNSKSEVPSSLRPTNHTTIAEDFTEPKLVDENVTRQDNKAVTQSVSHNIQSTTASSSMSKPNTYLLKKPQLQSPNRSLNQRLQMITVSPAASTVTETPHPQQQARSIIKNNLNLHHHEDFKSCILHLSRKHIKKRHCIGYAKER